MELFVNVLPLVLLEVTTEHTEYTEFLRKNTEYRFAYGKHGKTKEVGIADHIPIHCTVMKVFSRVFFWNFF